MIRTCSYLKAHAEAFIFGLVLIWMAAAPGSLWCQSSWPSYPNNNTITVTSGGNVGIGAVTPATSLEVTGSIRSTANTPPTTGIGVELSYNTNLNIGRLFAYDRNAGVSKDFAFGTGANQLYLSASGNVGIGTTNPQYLLSVKGTVGAQEFIVTNTGWSDYVFRPDYRLRPLSEVSQYIQANGHLPDIPTEAEVKEKGVSIGDMQAKLLAKVEELTLHMIRQEKENGELRDKMNEQTKEIQDLRERLAKSAATDSRPAVAK